jgi:hypothetical protein
MEFEETTWEAEGNFQPVDADDVTTKHTKYTKLRGKNPRTMARKMNHPLVSPLAAKQGRQHAHFVSFVSFVVITD